MSFKKMKEKNFNPGELLNYEHFSERNNIDEYPFDEYEGDEYDVEVDEFHNDDIDEFYQDEDAELAGFETEPEEEFEEEEQELDEDLDYDEEP